MSRIPHYTLKQVLGSVPTPPHLHGKDTAEMIREAKEARAQRLMQTIYPTLPVKAMNDEQPYHP
jgi:hypothetical protein